MKPEVNAVLQEVKAHLANPKPAMPDFKTMSIMEATKYCVEQGVTASKDIASVTGKSLTTVQTALWKLRNPKKVKAQYRRAKKLRDIKAGIAPTPKAKPTKIKKPKIENGLYDDGMDTPYLDAIKRRGVFPDFVKPRSLEIADEALLMAENRRLKILVEHYETLLFKKGG
jgi:hypothetical protein